MTPRQVKVCKAILDFLNDCPVQIVDTILHAGVNELLGEFVPLTEFAEEIERCDKSGWVISVKTQFKGFKRKISDDGRSARVEMR